MTPFTKPEVHNALHYCQRRIEPWPQVACTANFVKFERVIFEICERTDRHTDTLIAILRTAPGAEGGRGRSNTVVIYKTTSHFKRVATLPCELFGTCLSNSG